MSINKIKIALLWAAMVAAMIASQSVALAVRAGARPTMTCFRQHLGPRP